MTARGIEVWLLDLERACDGLHESAARLGLVLAEDIAHVARLRGGPLRQRRHAMRIALRLALWQMAGRAQAFDAIMATASGKPMLPSGGLEFSLAHNDTHALIAISRAGPVGVDIENVRPVRISHPRRQSIEVAGRLLVPGGLHALSGSDEAFVQAWTRIEALAKATGDGAAVTLARLGVRHPGADEATVGAAVAIVLTQPPAGPALDIIDLALPPRDGVALMAACAHVRGVGAVTLSQMPDTCEALLRLAI